MAILEISWFIQTSAVILLSTHRSECCCLGEPFSSSEISHNKRYKFYITQECNIYKEIKNDIVYVTKGWFNKPAKKYTAFREKLTEKERNGYSCHKASKRSCRYIVN